jgi:hypothetical protein
MEVLVGMMEFGFDSAANCQAKVNLRRADPAPVLA